MHIVGVPEYLKLQTKIERKMETSADEQEEQNCKVKQLGEASHVTKNTPVGITLQNILKFR
jgi:hypothetical protein